MTAPDPALLPVLYSFRRCPYAMRARLALHASGQPCALREVVLRDKPAELLAVSPKGTVPVLVLPDGTVIDQSLDIMLWALRRNDPAGWLRPGEGTLDGLLALVADCDQRFKPALDRYKYPGRFEGADPLAHRAAGAAFLQPLDMRLQNTRHLAGDHATLADAAIAPFVRQFAAVEPDWFAAQPWPHLRAWLDAWTATTAFAEVMVRHTPWRAGLAEPVLFAQEAQ